MINKTAYAVCGANFGDEGKGLTTDYLCSKIREPVTVVRFNGGAQAGHTVQTPKGQRHVFHHAGSGSFLPHVTTYLGQHFICNPILFDEERTKLLDKHVPGLGVIADPRCLVSTPWDMMINRFAETQRGLKRHGSCGVGINETVMRNTESVYGLTLQMAHFGYPGLRTILRNIQYDYVPYRLKQLELEPSRAEQETLFSKGIAEHYYEDLEKFITNVRLATPGELTDNIIFEGAQGLGLDEHRGVFPYVTRSNTGLQNVMDLCGEIGIDTLKAVYVTRPYITRHGEGPLSHELKDKPWTTIHDHTNIPNKWQGMLRFGWMDETELSDRINLDLFEARRKVHKGVQIDPTIMLTCVDQIPGSLNLGLVPFWQDNQVRGQSVGEFLAIVRQHIGASPYDNSFVSLGPTRADVLPLISSRAKVEA